MKPSVRPGTRHWLNRRGWATGIVLGVIGLGTVLLVGIPRTSPTRDPRVAVGLPAPELRATLLDGSPVSLKGLRGKPVLVNFFATWCTPCLAELPHFDRLHQAYADRLQVLMVNVGEAPQGVRAFVEANGFRFPVVLDSEGQLAGAFGVYGIPWTVVIDARGTVRAIRPGPVRDWDDLMGLVRGVLER